MRGRRAGLGRRGPGLLGTMARTAVIAGTASAVAGGVADRREARAHQQQAQADRQVAAAPAGGLSDDSFARLQQLGDLLRQGILTEDEFAAQKAKILGS